jgi:hypothetical protein
VVPDYVTFWGLLNGHLKTTCKVHKKIIQYDVADVFVDNSLSLHVCELWEHGSSLRLFNDIVIDDVFASNVMHHHAKGGWLLVFEGESIGQICFLNILSITLAIKIEK